MISLVLILGSAQAQVSYYCEMMDTLLHDDCCCADSDVDDSMLSDSEPCCDKSVNLYVDTAADQVQTQTKSIKFESDVDPPDAIVFVILLSLASPDILSLSVASDAQFSHATGSATYLITQRLRI